MRERYRIYQRNGGIFYAKDRKTGQAFSLATTDRREALRLIAAKNQSTEQPALNVAMAKVYPAQARLEHVCTDTSRLVHSGFEFAFGEASWEIAEACHACLWIHFRAGAFIVGAAAGEDIGRVVAKEDSIRRIHRVLDWVSVKGATIR